MQLKQLSPVAAAILAALLSACGGGSDDSPPPPAPPPAIIVAPINISSATPANAQTPLAFTGGTCSGGTGALTATWDFGDGTGSGSYAPHEYATEGSKTVKVTCTDSTGKTGELEKPVTIASAAMNGFLGRNWTTYVKIESNIHPYPAVGITSAGAIYGAWIRSAVGLPNEVATGTTNFSRTGWNVSTDVLETNADRSPFIIAPQNGARTAAIDMAVSPNGHAISAWMAGTKIWYATKADLDAAWTTPLAIDVAVLDKSIKVAINDNGVGAIAYCTNAGVHLIHNLASPTPTTTIGNQCDEWTGSQRLRSFDIAMDNATVHAVGIGNGTAGSDKVVNLHSCTVGGACATPQAISGQLTAAPKSLSFSLSPNGSYAAIAWDQIDVINGANVSNVYASIYAPGTPTAPTASWGQPMPVHNYNLSLPYTRPLVAINDFGDVFLAMQLQFGTSDVQTMVTNYQTSATPPKWRDPQSIANFEYSATDVAIDKYGTGLITRYGGIGGYSSQATTYSKTGEWERVWRNLSPVYSSGSFRYQTMRALPDGKAILATSVYNPASTTSVSGYTLLK